MRKVVGLTFWPNFTRNLTRIHPELLRCPRTKITPQYRFQSAFGGNGVAGKRQTAVKTVAALTIGCGFTVYLSNLWIKARPVVLAASTAEEVHKPDFKPTRTVCSF